MYLQSSELCKFQRRLHDSRIRFLFCHDKWWLFCYCLIKAKFISPWANDFATIISTIETWSYLSTACACLPACAPFYWIRLVIQGVWKKIVLVMYVSCEVTVLSLYAYLAEIFIYFCWFDSGISDSISIIHILSPGVWSFKKEILCLNMPWNSLVGAGR